jgi:hypothetical protein
VMGLSQKPLTADPDPLPLSTDLFFVAHVVSTPGSNPPLL